MKRNRLAQRKDSRPIVFQARQPHYFSPLCLLGYLIEFQFYVFDLVSTKYFLIENSLETTLLILQQRTEKSPSKV